jgi:hypothetical protein
MTAENSTPSVLFDTRIDSSQGMNIQRPQQLHGSAHTEERHRRALILQHEQHRRSMFEQDARIRLGLGRENLVREAIASRAILSSFRQPNAYGARPFSPRGPSTLQTLGHETSMTDNFLASRMYSEAPALQRESLEEALRLEDLQTAFRYRSSDASTSLSPNYHGLAMPPRSFRQTADMVNGPLASFRQSQQTLTPTVGVGGQALLSVDPYRVQPYRNLGVKHPREEKSIELPAKRPTKKPRKRRLSAKSNAFPLPSATRTESKLQLNSKLTSFQRLWSKLEKTDMRDELFRRRLNAGSVPLTGRTKSAILQSKRSQGFFE